MLAKFSIRAKITVVVAFLLVAITGVGLLAITNMRSIHANTMDPSFRPVNACLRVAPWVRYQPVTHYVTVRADRSSWCLVFTIRYRIPAID